MNNQMQDAPLLYYKAKYRELDSHEAVTARTGLSFEAEKGRFRLEILGNVVFAAWPEFELIPEDSNRCPKALYGFAMQILAVRYLLEGVNAPPRGEFKSYRELPWGDVYDQNFQGRCIKRLAYSFGSKPDSFVKACEALGGVRRGQGDAAFDLPFLGGVTCRLILWCADEEFPPSAQFLFSDNTPAAFGAEDLAAVGDVVIGALKEIASSFL